MASDYVDDFLRDERESFKRKETAAKKFDNRLDNFRKSAQALRDAARQFEEAFPGMSRTMIADKLAMTGTEKNIAFDAKGELVAAPAGRKTVSAEPTVAPAADAATGLPVAANCFTVNRAGLHCDRIIDIPVGGGIETNFGWL